MIEYFNKLDKLYYKKNMHRNYAISWGFSAISAGLATLNVKDEPYNKILLGICAASMFFHMKNLLGFVHSNREYKILLDDIDELIPQCQTSCNK